MGDIPRLAPTNDQHLAIESYKDGAAQPTGKTKERSEVAAVTVEVKSSCSSTGCNQIANTFELRVVSCAGCG
jgi:hypothetical protein